MLRGPGWLSLQGDAEGLRPQGFPDDFGSSVCDPSHPLYGDIIEFKFNKSGQSGRRRAQSDSNGVAAIRERPTSHQEEQMELEDEEQLFDSYPEEQEEEIFLEEDGSRGRGKCRTVSRQGLLGRVRLFLREGSAVWMQS